MRALPFPRLYYTNIIDQPWCITSTIKIRGNIPITFLIDTTKNIKHFKFEDTDPYGIASFCLETTLWLSNTSKYWYCIFKLNLIFLINHKKSICLAKPFLKVRIWNNPLQYWFLIFPFQVQYIILVHSIIITSFSLASPLPWNWSSGLGITT